MAFLSWRRWLSAPPPAAPNAFADKTRLLAAAGIEARTIIDGGAYIGELTARYLSTFPSAHVYAVEPAPEHIARLQARFRDEPRVTVVPAALAERAGERVLSLNDADMTHSLLPMDPASPYFDYPVAPIGEVRVPAIDLDGFCRTEGLNRINLLKLDVQGAEAAVLAGAADLLAAARIDLLFTELCFVSTYEEQTTTAALLDTLDRAGYRLYDLYNLRRAPSGQVKWGDALFPSPYVRALAGI